MAPVDEMRSDAASNATPAKERQNIDYAVFLKRRHLFLHDKYEELVSTVNEANAWNAICDAQIKQLEKEIEVHTASDASKSGGGDTSSSSGKA